MRGREFAELQTFLAVAEDGSFSRAAGRLGLSRSVVSQTVRQLEERLGVRLLHRTTRSVAPSVAGERLLCRLRPLMADLDDCVVEAASGAGRLAGTLRINASHMAATRLLAPMVAPFAAQHPGIRLEIVADDRLVDIVAGRFDAGIRLGEKVERDMVAVPIGGPLRTVVVAAPAYVARHGLPRQPRDLLSHRCITTWWPTDLTPYRWEFERGGMVLDLAVEGPLAANDPDLGMRAAIDGLGIAYLFEHHVADAIARGVLVTMLDDWTPAFPGFFLYYPSRRQMSRPLRAFIDGLKAAHPAVRPSADA